MWAIGDGQATASMATSTAMLKIHVIMTRAPPLNITNATELVHERITDQHAGGLIQPDTFYSTRKPNSQKKSIKGGRLQTSLGEIIAHHSGIFHSFVDSYLVIAGVCAGRG